MNITFAVDEDFTEIQRLWRYCFSDTEGFIQYYFENKYKKHNTIIIQEDGQVMAAGHINPYQIRLNENIYNTSYIVGISAFPEVRGKGYTKVLMKAVLEEMHKRGQKIAILMPIDDRLYRRYGFEYVSDQWIYDLNMDDLRTIKGKRTFYQADERHVCDLVQIYYECVKDKNAWIERDEKYFSNLLREIHSEQGYIYLCKNDQEIDGYMIYHIIDDRMQIREILYKNIDALSAMLQLIYHHNTQVKKVKMYTPVEDKIRFLLPNLKPVEIQMRPFIMGRVIDFKGWMEQQSVDDFDSSFTMKINDPILAYNDQTFCIQRKQGKIHVAETTETPDIVIDIGILSQLVFSYISIEEALFLNQIQINKKSCFKIFKQLFKKKSNYIDEYV